ncbi:unnamed protein product [Acanthoscelides obtectus]|uniref:Uncharacterized protein n=1 Tax=Acanthoscelides obtectus TaxID=200917 RepID=A0A9P0JMC4_ACAOB|nr:unnamed protein product [Acanthoscelides obtectus]CAK1655091.1 hypothetical protein AOBTE_LOCUS19023 [Acanthoscelides obtectus]
MICCGQVSRGQIVLRPKKRSKQAVRTEKMVENQGRRLSLALPISLPQRQRRMSVRSFYWVMVNPMVIFNFIWFVLR